MKTTNNIKYFLYARKSTESDERQVQSLEDQINIMKQKANNLWIEIIEIFQESMSAKAPWRYRFNEMILRVQNWEARWIIAWKLDRLSRNPIDSWQIQYMLQTWKLDKIITNDREYNVVDAWLLMSVENWMANQYILDLSKNVKRWMDSKTEKWVFCWRVPEGYINNVINKTIEIDPINFSLIKKAWNLMVTWNYSVPQIMKIANNEWWYKSSKLKWSKLTESWMYWIFKNPFYTWDFLWKWEIKKWTHQPMITWEQYERVQNLIWQKWHTIRGKTKEFAYTWMMKCWECWCSIVWEEKSKYIKSTNTFNKYVYYRCSKRIKWCTCKQNPINLKLLEKQINEIIWNIEILPQFKEWWLEILKRDFHEIKEEKNKAFEQVEKSISNLEKQKDTLLNLLIDEVISKNEYSLKKEKAEADLLKFKSQRDRLETNKDESINYTEELIDFVLKLKEKFNNWSLKEKKLIFSRIGENFVLKDWILYLEPNPWIWKLINKLPNIKIKYEQLEPSKKASGKEKTKDFWDIISLWSGGPGLNWHTQGLKP